MLDRARWTPGLLLIDLAASFGCSREPDATKPSSNGHVGETASTNPDPTPASAIRGWYTATNLPNDKQGIAVDDKARQNGFVFLVVEVQLGELLWEVAGESFYKGPAAKPTVTTPDGDLATATAWATGDKFSQSIQTAFMPEPPNADERMRFAFLMDESVIEKGGLEFRYGDLPVIVLSGAPQSAVK